MDEIKESIKKEKLLIGTKQTIKALRKSTIAKILLANNCPDEIADDIKHYASIAQVEVEELSIACDELGSVCKKPFLISVVSILK